MHKYIQPNELRVKLLISNYPVGDLVFRAWDQGVCSPCNLKFEPCGY